MVKSICIMLISLLSVSSQAQESYVRSGLLSAHLTFSPSTMLNREENTYYLSGTLQYYLNEKYSIKGFSHLLLDSDADIPVFKENLRSHFGVSRHFTKNNWTQHIGFYPGLTVSKYPLAGQLEVSPSFALDAGTKFYVWKYFHFFANLTYVNSKKNRQIRTDELIFSAGLGFQINTRK